MRSLQRSNQMSNSRTVAGRAHGIFRAHSYGAEDIGLIPEQRSLYPDEHLFGLVLQRHLAMGCDTLSLEGKGAYADRDGKQHHQPMERQI